MLFRFRDFCLPVLRMDSVSKKFLKAFGGDASGFCKTPHKVVLPRNVFEVQEAVISYEKIIPRGGGSGFSGGIVPLGGEVTIDLSRINSILVDERRQVAEVGAGAVLSDINFCASKNNLEFPVDLPSREVCTIGGMIATNATGIRASKYGRTSNWVRWIDVVDSNGEILRKGITEISDFCGMEGTTGVIVRACIKLIEKPNRKASILRFDNLENLLRVVINFKRESSVSMVWFFNAKCSSFLGLPLEHHLIVEFEDGRGKMEGREYSRAMALIDKTYSAVLLGGFPRIEDFKIHLNSFIKVMKLIDAMDIPVFGPISFGVLHPCFDSKNEKNIPHFLRSVERLGGLAVGAFGIGILKKAFVGHLDRKIFENVLKRKNPSRKFNPGKILDG
ncbi:FAD-binding oxidoreductase [Candidatus Pacearchaeota archaeon]|nr:MAG: FAD-binding oxidoreductase [Candidatus Pacearchaeota archaeon]